MWPFRNQYKDLYVEADGDRVRLKARVESMRSTQQSSNEARDRVVSELRASNRRLRNEKADLENSYNDLFALKGQSDNQVEFYQGEAEKIEAENKVFKAMVQELRASEVDLLGKISDLAKEKTHDKDYFKRRVEDFNEFKKLMPEASKFMEDFSAKAKISSPDPMIRVLGVLGRLYKQVGEATTNPLMRNGKSLKVPQERGLGRQGAAEFGYRLEALWRTNNNWPLARRKKE